MTRTELCTEMQSIRLNITQVSLNDVWRQVGFQPVQTKRMERGQMNFNTHNFILYMTAIKAHILLSNGSKTVKITSYDDVVSWVIKTRGKQHTQRSLAELAGCSFVSIAKIESKKSIVSIDLFLQLIQALGYQLKIEAHAC